MNELKKRLKLSVGLLLLLFCSAGLQAQERTISGVVRDAGGEPIIGANIVEKKTSNGTVSDIDGNFSLNVGSDAVLQISYIGYLTREVNTSGRTSFDIVLQEDAHALDEVIVVGYGTVRKVDLSGSVASVSGEQLAAVRSTSVSQALQGSMPGVQVTRSNSLPGASATIRVRGVTTIGDSDPLIIVDGVPGSLSMDVDDIESISVLKDAASASIYGARAASGVIIVTTKRAKDGMLNIDYSGSMGFVTPSAFPGTVDYRRYMEMINEISWNDGGNIDGNQYNVYSKDFMDNYAMNHRENPNKYPLADWKSYLIKKTAPSMKHNVSMGYGNGAIKSMSTLGYETTDALYNNRTYAAFTARTNNDLKFNDYLAASVDGSYRRGISENAVVNPLQAAYLYAPLWSPVWSDGRISNGRDGTNPYARINYGGFNNSWSDQLTGRFSLRFTPIKNLTITGVYAPTVVMTKVKNFSKQLPYYDANDPTLPAGYISGQLTTSLSEERRESRTVTKQLLANYSASFNNRHDLSLLAGYEDYYNFYETLGAVTDEMELSEYPYLDRGNLSNMTNSGNASEYAYRSWFGRVGYDFENRYLFQANARFDQSSRFHKDYRLGFFPSFSAGWIVSEEPFFKKLRFEPLTFFKLRGSWGSLGNERIGNYAYQSTMGFSNVLFVDNGNLVSRTTAAQRGYNIMDITWETTETWNLGLDLNFFNNKLSLSGDYYRKKTRDMLLALQIPIYMGYDNPSQNAGIMSTRGWDLQLGWNDRIGNDFTYSLSVNISDYKSVMGNLSGTVFDGATRIMEGGEYAEWYGYKSAGLFLSQEDIDNSPVLNSSVKVGDIKYIDISGPDGKPDGTISPEYDRVLLGGSLPRYIYGGNINMRYRNFDLGITFQGVGRQNSRITKDMAWQSAAWHTFPDFIDGDYFSHYNTEEQNASARFPRLSQIAADGNNYLMSDFWLFNGRYLRLKNLVVGYTLPKSAVNWMRLSSVRVYTSATDLFSIDNFPKGWDPEASTGGTAYIAKTFNFGVSVKF
jgi:TonB-linked SusC/RagA family outer membrane protein